MAQERTARSGANISAIDYHRLFEAVPGHMVVLAADPPRYTILAVTDAYLEAAGRTRAAMIGEGFFDLPVAGAYPDDASSAAHLRASFAKVLATGKPDQLPLSQSSDRLPDAASGQRHWMLLSKPVLDDAGKVMAICHQLDDVTDRVLAEERWRESEEHLRCTVELSTLVPWTADAQGRMLEFSQKWLDLTGLPHETAVREGWKRMPHPEDRPRMLAAWRQAIATGEPYALEHRIRLADGTTRLMRSRAVPLRDEQGQIVRWYGTTEDIQDRTLAERRNAFLVRLDDSLRPLTDAAAITQTAARMLGEELGVNRCAYADVEADEDTFNLSGDYNVGVPSIVGRYTFRAFGNECLRLMRAGEAYVVHDVETDPRTREVRASYRGTLIRAVICVPLLKEGRFVAAMAVHQRAPRHWRQHEVELLRQVASRCWESIERSRVERELREREQHYRFLAESIPQMVWTATPDGRLNYVNEQVTRYFGSNPDHVLGDGWLQWVHPDDQGRSAARWKASLEDGTPYEVAFRLRRADGAWRWHLVRAQPLLAAGGAVLQWFGTCTDFEDQKQAEEHLRKQWHTFDTALSHTPDFTYIFDREGRFTYINRALLSLWQKSLEEAVGKNFFELEYPPDLAARLQRQIQEVIETRQPVRDQTPYTGAAGETRHYEYIFVPIFDAAGNVEAVAGSTRDITEREEMEQALAASEERLQQVFAQAPVGVAVLRGTDMVFELVNPFYQGFLPTRDVLRRPLREALPELNAEIHDMLRGVVETGKPFVGLEYHVPLDRDGDGVVEDCWFTFVYQPLRQRDGAVTGVVAVANDVTTHVQARRELERVNRELEEFAYVASHDLQEPLRMINIYTQLLMRRFLGDHPEARQYAAEVHKGVSRMEALIRDLLVFSKTVHTEDLLRGRADLSAALADALSLLRERIEETGARIEVPPLPSVPGDTAQMAHVFQNLLSNALKYRRQGVRPEVMIRVVCDGNDWIISVSDNGIGFDSQYAERIFGLFKRLHKEEYPGTGLGLAICRRIVERHGGRIWASGVPGEGATFQFSLPRCDG